MKNVLKYGAPIEDDLIERAKVPREERVAVSPEDRAAAAKLGRRWFDWSDGQARTTLVGLGDDYPLVQALARHRLEALRDSGSHRNGENGEAG